MIRLVIFTLATVLIYGFLSYFAFKKDSKDLIYVLGICLGAQVPIIVLLWVVKLDEVRYPEGFPTALDAYRGNTELIITESPEGPDSTVVWSEEYLEKIREK